MSELTEKEALSKAAAYCSASEHCFSEIIAKLSQWGVAADVQEKIIKRLVDERFIDEERFCRFFVNDKFKFNKWGRKYLNDIDEREYMNTLRSLLASKKKSIHASDDYQSTMKLIRFAVSRGFEMGIIRKCMQLSDEYDSLD